MAQKYLDLTGLEHFWTKSKEYIDSGLNKKANTSHTHSYTHLTGSTTIANQAIVSNGTANGWALKTLGSNAFNSTTIPLTGYAESGNKNYAVKLDGSNKMYVSVPWTDTNTTYGIATNTTNGLIKPWFYHTAASTGPTTGTNSTAVTVNAITTTSGRYYALEMDNAGRGFVNVPWSNTTYTFANGSDGSFTVTPSGGSSQKVTIGKPATAGTADKVVNSLIIKVNSATSTEGTNIYTYNGSAAKTIDIKAGSNVTLTPSAGALTIAAKDTTYGVVGTNGSTGLVKNGSTVTNASGYTACPIVNGVPYYKDTNTTYTLSSFGITASSTELNYCKGVTSSIQTQINSKLNSSSYTASDVLNKLKTVDGRNSGLDADLYDGYQRRYSAGASETQPYCKVLTMKVSATYRDEPITFRVRGRNSSFDSFISISFAAGDNTDPSIAEFLYYGDSKYGAKLKLFKTATSTWELWCTLEMSGWDRLLLYDINDIDGVTITPNLTCATALPTSSTTKTPSLANFKANMQASSVSQSMGVSVNGSSLFTYNGSAAKTVNIKNGTNITVSGDSSGNITISNSYSYSLPTASTSVKGGVKVGNGLTVSSEVLTVNTISTADIDAIFA